MGLMISYLMREVNPIPVLLLAGSMPAAPPSQLCRLQLLPGELCNLIYELALVSKIPINITKDLKEAALLSTCKMIREEATEIWWQENKFVITIVDCNSDLLYKFRTLATPHDSVDWLAPCYIGYAFQGDANWCNLMQWCRRTHGGDLENIWQDPSFMRERVVAAATTIARTHRGLEWKRCELALVALRPVAGATDEEWSRDRTAGDQ